MRRVREFETKRQMKDKPKLVKEQSEKPDPLDRGIIARRYFEVVELRAKLNEIEGRHNLG